MTDLTPLSPEEIEEARRLCEAAPLGPWSLKRPWAGFCAVLGADGNALFHTAPPDNHDPMRLQSAHEFTAAARTLLPRALASIVEAERQRDEAVALLRDLNSPPNTREVWSGVKYFRDNDASRALIERVDAFLAKVRP